MNTIQELYDASDAHDQEMRNRFRQWSEHAAHGLHEYEYVPMPQDVREWLVAELSARLAYFNDTSPDERDAFSLPSWDGDLDVDPEQQ